MKDIVEENRLRILHVLYLYHVHPEIHEELKTYSYIPEISDLKQRLDEVSKIKIKNGANLEILFKAVKINIDNTSIKIPFYKNINKAYLKTFFSLQKIIEENIIHHSIGGYRIDLIDKDLQSLLNNQEGQPDQAKEKNIYIAYKCISSLSHLANMGTYVNHEDRYQNFLHTVKNYIVDLLHHIDGEKSLSKAQIELKITLLLEIGNRGIHFHMLDDIKGFTRARIIDQTKYKNRFAFAYEPAYQTVDELSYIKADSVINIEPGRLNTKGKSVFYASMKYKDEAPINVTLSEVRATIGDHVCLLHSEITKKEGFKFYYIGLWDYVRRDEKPNFMNQEQFNIARKCYDFVKDISTESTLIALQLIDAFFADIIRRPQNEYLYDVTSAISDILLKDETDTDAIVYTSVHAESQPLIAIKPSSVDKRVKHLKAETLNVEEDYGYGFFEAKTLDTASIDEQGNLVWETQAKETEQSKQQEASIV